MPNHPAPSELRRKTLELVEFIERTVPGCKIKFKDDLDIHWSHRIIHFFGRLVARNYDVRYTTVIYPHIYLPAGARHVFSATPERYYATLRHELVHLLDFRRFHLWFALSYAALLPAFWTFRGYWEMRGYTQNLVTYYELHGRIPDAEVERIARIFASRDYLFMMTPYRRALRTFLQIREDIVAGRIHGIYPYKEIPGAAELCYRGPTR